MDTLEKIEFPKDIKTPKGMFYISADIVSSRDRLSAFALLRRVDNSWEVILEKRSTSYRDMWKEVKDLAKYFNAPIMGGK